MTRSAFTLPNYAKLAGLLLAALAIFVADLKANKGAQAESAVLANIPQIVFVQTPKLTETLGAGRFPEGSRIVLLARGLQNTKPIVLTASFFAAADPQVDFAGKRVLFAGQRARGEYWQIWEMSLDSSGLRQITKCDDADCVRPAYLPADEIAFTRVTTESGRRRTSLQVVGLDGSNLHAVTFGPGEWWLETVLRDGRILASANSPLTDGSENRLLYTLRPDGTGVESLRCEHTATANRGEATELEDGTVAFTQGSGALMAIKRGALHEEKISTARLSYKTPSTAGQNSIVVATKAANAQRYQLSIIAANGIGQPRTIYGDPQFDAVEPVTVEARPVPRRFWSNLILSSSSGYFIALDSANTVEKPNSVLPIRKVRVLARNAGGEVALGEAPVESDGSFYLSVPANQAVRFVLLDEHGAVVREERSWVWTRPGEQRGCTGCHGDKALAPENRWPLALRRKEPPTMLSGAREPGAAGENRGH